MRTDQIVAGSSPTFLASGQLDVSVIIVSFNTREVLRKCLQHLRISVEGVSAEVIVIDNNSRDGSADLVELEFPEVQLIRSRENLGFAAANNLAIRNARGQYVVLLNSDAFVSRDGIRLAFSYMQADPGIGLGGARLVGVDGSWQPSARQFPSLLNDLLILTGLADRFPKSHFLGRADRSWADPELPTDADWVPGAFAIVRKEVVGAAGYFDESFFLYYEEVDLCRRIRKAGYRVRYFPDVVVVHLGGESSKKQEGFGLSAAGKQVTLWRFRSHFLYYRKHHGAGARLAMWTELNWHRLRLARNILRGSRGHAKVTQSRSIISIIDQAWRDTRGGRFAPPRPW
jgi:GT2 family glycosyltransferase